MTDQTPLPYLRGYAPELLAQVRELIFKGAERKGRVNLINPKASVALLKGGAA